MSNLKCIGCDTPIPPGKNKCPMCGAPVAETPAPVIVQKPIIEQQNQFQPIKQKAPGMSAIKAIALGFSGLFVISMIVGNFTPPDKSPEKVPTMAELEQQKKQQKAESEKYDAKYYAKQFVESGLKAPSTAKFQPMDEILCDKKNGIWEVYLYVDAQNSFGAMLRNKFHVKLQNQGDTWKLKDIQSY